MSHITCKYHTETPARWYCSHCQINFCKSCIKQQDAMRLPDCPVCQRKLNSLGSENLVTPFWLRLGKFFLYPLHSHALLFISALSLVGVLLPKSNMGMLLSLVLMIVFMKYCFAVIENTAIGHLRPLPVTDSMVGQEMELPFKLFAVVLAVNYGMYWVGDNLGFLPYVIALVIGNLALPANIMVLAIEHSLFAALNPVVVFPMIKRIGLPYLFLCLLLFLLNVAEATALDILLEIFPYSFAYSVFLFTTMFFSVVMAHLLGYTLYQYHQTLGIIIEKEADDFEKKPEQKQAQTDPELRKIEILVQEGKHNEAVDQLSRYIASNPASKPARERLLKLLQLTGNTQRLLNEGQKFITYLTASGQPAEALSTFLMVFRINPQFRPALAEERLQLAQLLSNSGQAKEAIALLNNLHVEFPDFKSIPEAYLLVAKLLCEKMNNDQKARQVLDFIRLRYPGSAVEKEVDEYYSVVRQLAGAQ